MAIKQEACDQDRTSPQAVTVEEIFAVCHKAWERLASLLRQKAYMCRSEPGHFSLTRNMIEIENQNLLSRLF